MGNEGGVQASEVGADSRYKKYLIEVERQPQTDVAPYRPFEIAYLKKLFSELDPKSIKSIEIDALDHYYELREHPLYQRIRVSFKEELQKLKQKRVTFEIMLYLLIVFHIKSGIEDKYRFLFRLYDWDKDNKLSVNDLGQTFSILFGGSMYTQDTYVYMGEQYINQYGSGGFIKFETFMKIIPEDQVKQFMTFKFIDIQ